LHSDNHEDDDGDYQMFLISQWSLKGIVSIDGKKGEQEVEIHVNELLRILISCEHILSLSGVIVISLIPRLEIEMQIAGQHIQSTENQNYDCGDKIV